MSPFDFRLQPCYHSSSRQGWKKTWSKYFRCFLSECIRFIQNIIGISISCLFVYLVFESITLNNPNTTSISLSALSIASQYHTRFSVAVAIEHSQPGIGEKAQGLNDGQSHVFEPFFVKQAAFLANNYIYNVFSYNAHPFLNIFFFSSCYNPWTRNAFRLRGIVKLWPRRWALRVASHFTVPFSSFGHFQTTWRRRFVCWYVLMSGLLDYEKVLRNMET